MYFLLLFFFISSSLALPQDLFLFPEHRALRKGAGRKVHINLANGTTFSIPLESEILKDGEKLRGPGGVVGLLVNGVFTLREGREWFIEPKKGVQGECVETYQQKEEKGKRRRRRRRRRWW